MKNFIRVINENTLRRLVRTVQIRTKKITKEEVKKAFTKIQKKIHPDVSPETSRLSAIVNEAKELVLKDIA